MNFTKRIFLFGAVLLCALTLNSCRRSIGYSALLWDIPEKDLQDGQIVKVYLKSNISQVYIIGIPGTNENYEVPLWQLTNPQSKKKAIAAAKKYEEYEHQYAHIKIDGLPVRAEAVNTSKQVYRLHKNEVVRILYKGEGQDVIMGTGEKLEGDWLCILTTGGTQGWCFSYNLSMYTTGPGGEIVAGIKGIVETDENDYLLDQVLDAKWYPEGYRDLIKDKTIDLESMKTDVAFDPGTRTGTISINLPDRKRSAEYFGVKHLRDNIYEFNNSPFQMIINDSDEITVTYTGTENKPEAYTFITVSGNQNMAKLLEAEKERRDAEIKKLADFGAFKSTRFGTLNFTESNSFTWENFEALVPAYISKDAKEKGTVSIKYLVSKDYRQRFDGVLTFVFEGTSQEVNFFYKLTKNSLSLEVAKDATFKGNIAILRGSNPAVLTFTK